MKDHRQGVVLATKYSLANPGTDPNAAGNQRKNMMQALEARREGCGPQKFHPAVFNAM
jgi:aryl-alcohol dehydrogenase-like predicted oxidoreductase